VIRHVSDNVNTRCITIPATAIAVSQDRAERLRAAREKSGYKSAAEAARAFGWQEPAYRHHENGTRGFGLDAAKKYGRAFKVKAGWLLCMEGVDGDAPTDYVASDKLIVGGIVAAGIWREPFESTVLLEIDTPPPVPNVRRLGYRLEGRSMDLVYESGSILDCISIYTNGVEPTNGDHVIVERTKPDGLREMTCKEFQVRDGENYLIPRSSSPEFKDMAIGKPDQDAFEDDEVRVIAFVVGVIPPRALALLERLGKVRRIAA
jgi:phage repressor protein C with HTH and peptisase S24 domain